jgi:outer membrane murein-binding lipoprotein Lpp
MNSTRTPRGLKPCYFADPATDKLLQMVITLAGELSVVRDRLDLVERLAQKAGILDRNAIETAALAADEEAERAANRADFVARVLRVLDQDLAEISDPESRGFDELVAKLGEKE